MTKVIVFAVALVMSLPAMTTPRKPSDCTENRKKSARKEASLLYAKTKVREASTLLQKMTNDCPERTAEVDWWIRSDLGLYFSKTGHHKECAALLGPLIYPTGRFDELGDSKVDMAIEQNFNLCQAKDATETKFLKSGEPCKLKIKEAQQATLALPKGMWPKGVAAACLALSQTPDTIDPKLSEGEQIKRCPHLVLLTQEKPSSPVLSTELLPPLKEENPLREAGVCCNLGEIRAGQIKDVNYIEISGGGRNCLGGSALEETTGLYEWSGKDLKFIRDSSIGSVGTASE